MSATRIQSFCNILTAEENYFFGVDLELETVSCPRRHGMQVSFVKLLFFVTGLPNTNKPDRLPFVRKPGGRIFSHVRPFCERAVSDLDP